MFSSFKRDLDAGQHRQFGFPFGSVTFCPCLTAGLAFLWFFILRIDLTLGISNK